MTDAPERIWMPPLWEVGDGTIPTDGQCEDDDIYYLRSDLHEAAVAAARAEGMREALERVRAIKATTASFGPDDAYGNGAVWACQSCESAVQEVIKAPQ